jgi:hypothetical protein
VARSARQAGFIIRRNPPGGSFVGTTLASALRLGTKCGCPPHAPPPDKDTSPAKGGLSASQPCPYVLELA